MIALTLLELPAAPSLLLQLGFVLLSLALAAFVGWWSRRPLIPALWLLLTAGLALGGVLQLIVVPPPLLLLLVVGLVGLVSWHGRGRWRDIPLRLLVGMQSFRIVVELLIHLAVVEGVAPEQLTWTGLNFDLLTGLSALLLFPFAERLPRWALMIWNLLALGLLINVVTVAILSLPLPIQQFEPVNAWVAFFPFQWLPMVMVMLAALGHVALFRRLRRPPGNARTHGA